MKNIYLFYLPNGVLLQLQLSLRGNKKFKMIEHNYHVFRQNYSIMEVLDFNKASRDEHVSARV
jgi:hypothetical protein